MSETVELSATEAAQRLLPLLKEYSAKIATISERGVVVLEQLQTHHKSAIHPSGLEAGRLICLHEALEKPVTDLAREASGLIEHAALEYHLRAELKLRLDELEEHIKFAAVFAGELIAQITPNASRAEWVRKLIEKSGRYKAPF